MWRADFVDRQVKVVLEKLFSRDEGMLLVNHVLRKLKNLTAEEVRGSLRRCEAHLDCLLVPVLVIDPSKGESLRQLIEAGMLRVPVDLSCRYKGRDLSARIERNGTVSCLAQTYQSLSIAAGAARASVRDRRPNGSLPPTNGWTFWKYRAADGTSQEIDHARRAQRPHTGARTSRTRSAG